MAKGFNPIYVYPGEKSGYFRGDSSGDKRIKDLKGKDHTSYEGWWPCFFPTTIGFLVTGTAEKPNVMTIGCMAVVNAHPFMIGMPVFAEGESQRGSGCRYSLELLLKNPEFTLNIPYVDPEMTKRILVCGSISGRDGVDKIAKAKFTPLASRHVSPPILKECPLNLECRMHSQTPMGSHHWIVGQVEVVYLDEELAKGKRQFVWRSLPELRENDLQ